MSAKMTGPELVRQCKEAWPSRNFRLSKDDTIARAGIYVATSYDHDIPMHVKANPTAVYAVFSRSLEVFDGQTVMEAVAKAKSVVDATAKAKAAVGGDNT